MVGVGLQHCLTSCHVCHQNKELLLQKNNERKLKVKGRAVVTFPLSTDKNKRRHLPGPLHNSSAELVQTKLVPVSCFVADIFCMLLLSGHCGIMFYLCPKNDVQNLAEHLFTALPCDFLPLNVHMH